MGNRIIILPESLANQIAAGEVIQRPASVIKELVENSLDAAATKIDIIVKNGGKTLIQVIDNGIGMSETDARMAFERHATSKISKPEDLFNITTKGFRGEALASIASVSKVELKTRREEDKLGTRIIIEGNRLILQEPVDCPKGANFAVKSLFFNVPARRRFLKSDSTEFKHILTEFLRVAIPHYDTEFSLQHNNSLIYSLKASNLRERILALFSKSYNKFLVPVEADLGFLKISGFITKPEFAKKSKADQYFFVNKRFMKNSYFHKAVLKGYGRLLPPEVRPSYFIFFEIDPKMIDVNIHPTKTEINFENAPEIYNLLESTVRRALVRFSITPSIDFDTAEFTENLTGNSSFDIKIPGGELKKDYNPFETEAGHKPKPVKITPSQEQADFEAYLEDLLTTDNRQQTEAEKLFVLKGKYIVTAIKSGISIINVRRALEQINFEKIFDSLSGTVAKQATLYPLKIDFSKEDFLILGEILKELRYLGFELVKIGETSYNITASPDFLPLEAIPELLADLINFYKDSGKVPLDYNKQKLAEIMAKRSVPKNLSVSLEEAKDILSRLFMSESVDYTFDGRKIIHNLPLEEIDKFFR